MKKFLSVFLSFAMLLSLGAPALAAGSEAIEDEGITYIHGNAVDDVDWDLISSTVEIGRAHV